MARGSGGIDRVRLRIRIRGSGRRVVRPVQQSPLRTETFDPFLPIPAKRFSACFRGFGASGPRPAVHRSPSVSPTSRSCPLSLAPVQDRTGATPKPSRPSSTSTCERIVAGPGTGLRLGGASERARRQDRRVATGFAAHDQPRVRESSINGSIPTARATQSKSS